MRRYLAGALPLVLLAQSSGAILANTLSLPGSRDAAAVLFPGQSMIASIGPFIKCAPDRSPHPAAAPTDGRLR
jgi:hypothetical protein